MGKEVLKASGVKEEGITLYVSKLNHLLERFVRQETPHHESVRTARTLFEYLWKEKPIRYQSHGSFRLNEVIDSQLSESSQAVGNCLGLTLLYNCLLQRMGIRAEALYLEEAFGVRPHVLTVLPIKGFLVYVENILSSGFDYKGHQNKQGIRWGDKEQVADIYHSLGNEFLNKGELNKALGNYNIAIHLNPNYENAHLNRAILLDKMESEKKGEYHREE